MGFKKTQEGNLIYEFDFTPTMLVPLTQEDAGGNQHCYAVEGANGERAPVVFEFQGERHKNYALAFGFITDADGEQPGKDMCVCSNIALVASMAAISDNFEKSWDEKIEAYTIQDPRNTETLAKTGYSFNVMPVTVAKSYMLEHNIPMLGYDVLREHMA